MNTTDALQSRQQSMGTNILAGAARSATFSAPKPQPDGEKGSDDAAAAAAAAAEGLPGRAPGSILGWAPASWAAAAAAAAAE